MRLTNLVLKNFRNYSEVEVNTDSDLVLILGPNASGKTNFLESIYFLSRLSSFRVKDNLLVKAQEDYFKIAGHLGEQKLEAMVQLTPSFARQYKIDDLKIKRTNWKTFSNVLFIPQDLNLFELGPTLRRKFLNQVLSQVSLNYALDLAALDHILKQRTAVFERIFGGQSSVSDLEIWDQELAQVSVRVALQRRQLVDFFNQRISESYQSLTGFDTKIHLEYKSIEVESVEDFLNKLQTYQSAEIRSGQNLYGPHRDDFEVKKDNQPNLDNSSRGELRSQILALKLLQSAYLTEHNLNPIIFLDDVFSELDEIRRTKLLENLKGHQIFITSTEEHHLPQLAKDVQVLKVGNNQIK